MARIGHDPIAFEGFYREHVHLVQRFIARRVDDAHLAADLTADVFLAVIDSAHTYRAGRGDPVQWLYGVARNVVNSELRRQARGLRATSRIAGRALTGSADIADIEARIDAEAQARRLHRAMNELSDGDRAVLELVALDHLSIQDVATVLGIRLGTARMRLHRARRRMQRHLSPTETPTEVMP